MSERVIGYLLPDMHGYYYQGEVFGKRTHGVSAY